MKKIFIVAIVYLSVLTTNTFAEIKMGIILGFTGPIESLTPAMAASAELAFQEASDEVRKGIRSLVHRCRFRHFSKIFSITHSVSLKSACHVLRKILDVHDILST